MSFMTDKELVEGTGYTQAAAQVRYLQRERIAHRVNAFGHPIVTWAAWEGLAADDKYQTPKSLCGAEYVASLKAIRTAPDPFTRFRQTWRPWLQDNLFACDVADSGIYLLMHRLEILYVGLSVNIGTRLMQHWLYEGKRFLHVAHMEVERELLTEVESFYILALRPPWNIRIPYSNVRIP